MLAINVLPRPVGRCTEDIFKKSALDDIFLVVADGKVGGVYVNAEHGFVKFMMCRRRVLGKLAVGGVFPVV